MVTMSYEWQAGKWLFQGLMASVLSGVGFVFLTIAFEYGKRYRRKRREREQQVILEKLLRGDVVLEWKNPKAVVPVNKGCVLRDLSSSNRGSFLINNYKQHGGFLGVGRGYYARRNKPAEESNSQIEHTDNKMITFTKFNTRIQDSSQSAESENKTPDPTVRIVTPGNTENKDEARIFQNMINSQSTMSDNSVQRKESDDPAPKITSQSHVCKKMCEEMCYRIVKEHPFIAPFIRHDLLQELQLYTAAEPKASNSGTTPNLANVAPKWMQMCKSLCLPDNDHTNPTTVKCIPKIKKRARSMSRCAQSKMRNTPTQLEKRDLLIQKTSMSGVSRKADVVLSKKTSDIKSECQRLNSITSTAPRCKLLKNFRNRRSLSLCRKLPLSDSDTFTQISKLAQNTTVATKQGTANVSDDKCAKDDEKGSSVDPLTVSPSQITEHSKNSTNRRERNEEINYGGDRNLAETSVKEDSMLSGKQSEQCVQGTETKSSTEGRINEIVSALTSWGYSIKNKVQGRDMGPTTTLQKNSFDGETRPGLNILNTKENTDASKLDSKGLIDLIRNLASSRKNRKLLRQISSVLDTNKAPGRMSKNSKSFTRSHVSPMNAATTGAPGMVKSPGNIHDSKDKKNSFASDMGSKAPQDIKKVPVVKRRRIVRERSYFAKLSSIYKKESTNENVFYQTSVLPSNQAKKVSPPRTETELKVWHRGNTSPQKRRRKSPKNNNLKRLIIKKVEPSVFKKPISKVQSWGHNSPLPQETPCPGDNTEVVVCTKCSKHNVEIDNEKSAESRLKRQSNSEITTTCSNDVENTEHMVDANLVGKTKEADHLITVPENINTCLEHDNNDTCIHHKHQTERESQTPDPWIINKIISCRLYPPPSPVNEEVVHEEEQDNVCAEAPSEISTKEADTVSQSNDSKLPETNETGIRASGTFNKQRKVERQTEQRHTIFTRSRPKLAGSNSARKSPHISAGDFFSEIHTLKPAQRKTDVASCKPAGVAKSNFVSKIPTSANKSGNRKPQGKAGAAEKPRVSVNSKPKEQQIHTFVKRGKKTQNESIKSIPNKTRENIHVASKVSRQKSNETRSRFEQYQKNQLMQNTSLRRRTSPVNKQVHTELNQNINQASQQHTERDREADRNQISDNVGQQHTLYTSPLLLPSSVTYTYCSMESVTPDIMADSLEAEGRHEDYHQMLGACVSFGNDQFESHSDGEDAVAWESRQESNICQQPLNILRKSKLDIVVSSMLNAKSIFQGSDT